MKGSQPNERSATKNAYVCVKETAGSHVYLYHLQNTSYTSLYTQNYLNSHSNIHYKHNNGNQNRREQITFYFNRLTNRRNKTKALVTLYTENFLHSTHLIETSTHRNTSEINNVVLLLSLLRNVVQIITQKRVLTKQSLNIKPLPLIKEVS